MRLYFLEKDLLQSAYGQEWVSGEEAVIADELDMFRSFFGGMEGRETRECRGPTGVVAER